MAGYSGFRTKNATFWETPQSWANQDSCLAHPRPQVEDLEMIRSSGLWVVTWGPEGYKSSGLLSQQVTTYTAGEQQPEGDWSV